MSFVAELKRRNVIRVAVAYLVASWLLIEASTVALEGFGAPEWVPKAVAVLLALGLPIALVFAWIFEVTPDGIKRESEIRPEDSVTAHTARKLDIAVIVLLVVAIGLFAYENMTADDPVLATTGMDVVLDAAEQHRQQQADSRAIAVLPFADMSPEGDQAYFADGIAEEILNLLAKNRELRVVARTSAFQFRDAADMRAVGEALEADRILEGSVRTAGTRVRITAQLIESETGYHLWSETYDRELTDIFAVQDEIAAAITEALGVHLGVVTSAQAAVGTDADAFHLYLQGRQAFNERATPGRLAESIEILAQAVAADPDLAVAHGTLALARSLSPWYTNQTPPEALRLTEESVDIALGIDPENTEALVARGYALAFLGYRPIQGLDWLHRALELRPNDLMANNLIGDVYRLIGDSELARRYELRAVELDPLSAITNWDYAWALIEDQDFDEALTYARRSTALEPENPFSFSAEVWSLLWTGRADEARAHFESRTEGSYYARWALELDALMLSIVMDDEDATRQLYEQIVAEMRAGDAETGVIAITAYTAGDFELAASLLERAVEEHDANWLTYGFNMGMPAELEAAGFEIGVHPDFEELYRVRYDSDWGRAQRLRAQLLELREAYRSGS